MPKREEIVPLRHMLGHAQEAVAMIAGKELTDLSSNRMLELALTRLLEIVGESAARVSQDVRKQFPEIPWKEVIGMRNRLIHGYDSVDRRVLWDTIELDLPPLIEELEKILAAA